MAQALEEAAKSVEVFTGLKNQFRNAGWSEPAAEQMVIGIVFSNARQS
jgi:hypothetical protein